MMIIDVLIFDKNQDGLKSTIDVEQLSLYR